MASHYYPEFLQSTFVVGFINVNCQINQHFWRIHTTITFTFVFSSFGWCVRRRETKAFLLALSYIAEISNSLWLALDGLFYFSTQLNVTNILFESLLRRLRS